LQAHSIKCQSSFGNANVVQGNGIIETVERIVSSFSTIISETSFSVYLTQGPLSPVKFVGESNIIPLIETEVQGEILTIRTKPSNSFRPIERLTIYVSTPTIKKIHLSSTGDVTVENFIRSQSAFEAVVSASGRLQLNGVNAQSVKFTSQGSGGISVINSSAVHSASNIDISISGSGSTSLNSVRGESINFETRSSGSISLSAGRKVASRMQFDAKASGSGSIRLYTVSAKKIYLHAQGSGGISVLSGYTVTSATSCDISVSGTGCVTLGQLNAISTSIETQSSGGVTIKGGKVSSLGATSNGSGSIDASQLSTSTAAAWSTSSGSIKVKADSLQSASSATGSGSIYNNGVKLQKARGG